MNAVAFFNSARAYKRELTGNPAIPLTQEDVDALNAATVGRWKAAEAQKPPKALGQPQAFFAAVRRSCGALEQDQVEGFNVLLAAMGEARWPVAFAAYGLATAWHETNHTMQPVVEAYWLSEAWRKKNLRYYPWHGRGYVQLTWKANYEKASEELGVDLIADPDLAMRPAIAAKILVRGMEQGWFTEKRLSDYLPIDGSAGHEAYKAARRIINGQDKADLIAKIARSFDSALVAGEWA